MASRYSSYITANSSSLDSTKSNPSSSIESLNNYSKAVVKSDNTSSIYSNTNAKTSSLGSMMRKLIETKSRNGLTSKNKGTYDGKKVYVAVDFIAEDLKKKGVSQVGNIQKKLLKGLKKGVEGGSKGKERKALMDVKNENGNSRSLAMLLRSERELLNVNKDQQEVIVELKFLLQEKNTEVEKLKDLCLKQREEIKNLKSSILFPDVNVMDSHTKGLMEKQSSELSQAKQLIPSLQRQVTSLTGQLQCLADDLAEIKADRMYGAKGSYEANERSSMSQGYYTEEAVNSLEFSTTPGSPDDLFLKDLNPCLTPYTAKTKSKEFEVYDSTGNEWLSSKYNMRMGEEIAMSSCNREVSKSSDCRQCSKATNGSYRAACRSHEGKCTDRKQMHHKLF
ncbi:hypothetical protein LIER_07924 [Lithospermum erythrorhizon]|uniref:Uncharacterized protein n=1 Tax=Lithospermum erythrorhizon TaxID=34254 RepID=A0AAV3PAR3_LITER